MSSSISAGTTAGTAIAISGDTSGSLVLQTNGTTTAVTIDTSQNVGIGTTSPSYKLDVTGVARLGNGVTAIAPSATNIPSTAHTILSTTGGNGLFFGQYPSFAQWIQSSYTNPTTATYSLLLQPLGGNVGIGTSSADALLHVSNAAAKIRIGATASSAYLDISRDGATGYSIYNAAQADPYRGHVWQLGGTEAMRIDSSGNVLVTSVASLGYGTGSGGTVTQATSKITGVTLNKPTGQITMNGAALGSGAAVAFQVSNSLVTQNDTVITSAAYTGLAPNPANYKVEMTHVQTGIFNIKVTNVSVGSLSDALVINFAIIKGATS